MAKNNAVLSLILITVLVALFLGSNILETTNTQPITGKVHEIPPVLTGRSAAPLYNLTISLENLSVTDLGGSTAIIKVLKLNGSADGSIAFSNIFHTRELYIGVQNFNPAGISYVGKVIYNNGTNWVNYSLQRRVSGSIIRYNNILNETSSLPNMNITYYPRATNATRLPVQIIISGRQESATSFSSSEYQGIIQIIDGYNSTTSQGGLWVIPFKNDTIGVIPANLGSAERYRSIRYLYYNATYGPYYYTESLVDISLPSSSIPYTSRYFAIVKNGFQSPTATRIMRLTRTLVQLTQFPTYLMPGTNNVNRFNYTCIDTDPTQDILSHGTINFITPLAPSGGVFIPHTSENRDVCYLGIPPVYGENFSTGRNASIYQSYCNAAGLPQTNYSYNGCPTPACGIRLPLANTTCARETVAFTCTDNDETNNPLINQSVIVNTSLHSWLFQDNCVNSTHIAELFCTGSQVNSTLVQCPEGTTCRFLYTSGSRCS